MQFIGFCVIAVLFNYAIREELAVHYRLAETERGRAIGMEAEYGTSKRLSLNMAYFRSDRKIHVTATGTMDPDSIYFLEDVNLTIDGFQEVNSHLDFAAGGTIDKKVKINNMSSYRALTDSIIAACSLLDTASIEYSITRTYEQVRGKHLLPDTLSLKYDIQTMYGNVSGSRKFVQQTGPR
jgi:hypothetical protein